MTVCLSPNGVNVYRVDAPPTRLLVGTRDGVAILERAGAGSAWRMMGRVLEGHHIGSLLVEPTTGAILAGEHWGGVHVSEDGGQTWELRADGIAQAHVFTLRCQTRPDGRSCIFAGTEPVSLYWSEDLGRTWHDLPSLRDMPGQEHWRFPIPPHIAHTKTMAFDPRDPDVYYVGIEQGALFKTTDGGQTWTELKGFSSLTDRVYSDVHQVALRPSNPDELFMTTGLGLFYSPNQGETWEQRTTRQFRVGYPDQLLFSPADDTTLFMSGSHDSPGSWLKTHLAQGTVLRSRDSGRTWEPCGTGLPDPLRANVEAVTLAAYPGGFSLLAGTTDGELFASDDGGDHWSAAATGLGAVSKVSHFENLPVGVG